MKHLDEYIADKTIQEAQRVLVFVERAMELGISKERALFLAMCPHHQMMRKPENKTITVPYDVRVQLAEAARLGMSAKTTAEMMGMTKEEVLSYGIIFPRKTTHKKAEGDHKFTLFQFEPHLKKDFRL